METQDYRKIVASEIAAQRWTLTDLAGQAGVSRSRISEWLAGKTGIGDDKLARVAAVLEIKFEPET